MVFLCLLVSLHKNLETQPASLTAISRLTCMPPEQCVSADRLGQVYIVAETQAPPLGNRLVVNIYYLLCTFCIFI
jgi:hypothetical protein